MTITKVINQKYQAELYSSKLDHDFLQELHDLKLNIIVRVWINRQQKLILKDLRKRNLPAPILKSADPQQKSEGCLCWFDWEDCQALQAAALGEEWCESHFLQHYWDICWVWADPLKSTSWKPWKNCVPAVCGYSQELYSDCLLWLVHTDNLFENLFQLSCLLNTFVLQCINLMFELTSSVMVDEASFQSQLEMTTLL